MAMVLVEGAIAVQGIIDFLIAGQMLRVSCSELPCGLAFGISMVGDTVFGHQFSGLVRQLIAHQVTLLRVWFGHVGNQSSWSLTVSDGFVSSPGAGMACVDGTFS